MWQVGYILSVYFSISLFLPLCLLYRPECIAAGALLLADQYLSEEVSRDSWQRIGVDLEEANGTFIAIISYFYDSFTNIRIDVATAIIDYLIVNQPRRYQLSNGNKV
jgi:hypothetical protein